MKLKSILLATAFTAFAAAYTGAYADDTPPPQDKAEAAKTEKAATKKPVKPHNHAEEKTGMPVPASSGKHEMSNEEHKQMMKHDHTKDRH